jgi:aminoglycoside phosphotransferase (APT) family kinase protein
MDSVDQLAEGLSQALADTTYPAISATPGAAIRHLRRLSGGANMETWSFDWEGAGRSVPLILRRLPAGAKALAGQVGNLDLATEAAILQLAARHGVRVPEVVQVLRAEHQLGSGYIMTRERGEALPNRILSDPIYARTREGLAFECGRELAKIHGLPLAGLPAGLRDLSPEQDLDRLQGMLDEFGNVSPVHQLALNWLRAHRGTAGTRCLVHGDFRNGNLLVDEQGLVAVLDWELAHIGCPEEDLGYLCANVWRFGRADRPVGGFGNYHDLLAGYQSVAGHSPRAEDLRYWEIYAALNWGLVCLTMLAMYRTGQDRSLERAAVGRRMSESEIDLLLLLEEAGA